MNNTPNIAILASHNASNLDPIYEAIQNKQLDLNISILISNNSNSNCLKKAKKLSIPYKLINSKNSLDENLDIYNVLKKLNCKYIFLSGYMKKISSLITNNFIVINCHPALLPAYGGKGMYGRFVHEAVIKNKEKISGITIHYVNENYDEGEIILQEQLSLSSDETIDSLENKIKTLEKNSVVKALNICLKSQK